MPYSAFFCSFLLYVESRSTSVAQAGFQPNAWLLLIIFPSTQYATVLRHVVNETFSLCELYDQVENLMN